MVERRPPRAKAEGDDGFREEVMVERKPPRAKAEGDSYNKGRRSALEYSVRSRNGALYPLRCEGEPPGNRRARICAHQTVRRQWEIVTPCKAEDVVLECCLGRREERLNLKIIIFVRRVYELTEITCRLALGSSKGHDLAPPLSPISNFHAGATSTIFSHCVVVPPWFF